MYDKPTANIIQNAEKLKAFPLRSGPRQGYPFSPVLLSIVLEAQAGVIKQEKEIEDIQIGKEEVKISLFADNLILNIENNKNSTKKLLEQINKFSKLARYRKSTYRKLLLSYTLTTKHQKKK